MEAINIAKLIITKLKNSQKENDGLIEITSRLKLLKLLYYVQGYHLAKFGKPLFKENIEAWLHGPVVREVYNWLKPHDDFWLNEQILTDEEIAALGLNDTQNELIDDVLKIYNKYSAYGLRGKMHSEQPWLETYDPENQTKVINNELMASYFSGFLA